MRALLVAAAYFATAWLGLSYPYYGEHVTLIWAPVGIALAAVTLWGPWMAAGAWLGNLAATTFLFGSDEWRSGIAIATGTTLGPLISGSILRSLHRFRPQLDRFRDVAAFVGIGVLVTSLITSSLGAATLRVFGLAPSDDFVVAWLTWLAGDASGILIVGAAMLAWLSPSHRDFRKERGSIEAVGLALTLAGTSIGVVFYGGAYPAFAYSLFPILLWAALRFGPRSVTLVALAIATTMVTATAAGVGPFSSGDPRVAMLSLWTFFTICGICGLLVTALQSEREYALHRQVHLTHELDHRVKNTLATVLAIAERSHVSARNTEEYLASFTARLRAMARTHEGMARGRWRGLDVEEIVAMTLAPFESNGNASVSRHGDPVKLHAALVGPLTMTLHELATNAAKHGAWSLPSGSVAVSWTTRDGAELEVLWREIGGPEISADPAPGYGLGLVEGLVAHELGGSVSLDFQPDGLLCTIRLSID
jgi:two-component sensor histidine kinase